MYLLWKLLRWILVFPITRWRKPTKSLPCAERHGWSIWSLIVTTAAELLCKPLSSHIKIQGKSPVSGMRMLMFVFWVLFLLLLVVDYFAFNATYSWKNHLSKSCAPTFVASEQCGRWDSSQSSTPGNAVLPPKWIFSLDRRSQKGHLDNLRNIKEEIRQSRVEKRHLRARPAIMKRCRK